MRSFALTLLSLGLVYAHNYGSKAVCASLRNLKTIEGLDACMLASALTAACVGDYTVAALHPPSNTYESPTFSEVVREGTCLCSTVTYNAFQACAACQGGIAQSWSAWKTSCSSLQISTGNFPKGVQGLNPNITIPNWSLIDTSKNNWVQSDAERVGATGSPNSIHKTNTSKTTIFIALGISAIVVIAAIANIKICLRRRAALEEGFSTSPNYAPATNYRPHYAQMSSEKSVDSLHDQISSISPPQYQQYPREDVYKS